MPPMICIIDDDPDVRASLENFLRAADVRVAGFASAGGFLAALPGLAPDCVITDLHMPQIDGVQLQVELNRRGRRFPLMVMTAWPTAEAEAECRRLGAADFFAKPIDPERLLGRITAILA